MATVAGRRLGLTPPRRWIEDLLVVGRRVPLVTIERRMDLGDLVAARAALHTRPAWALLLAKGWATVAARRPELRRAYVPFPWPHLYEAGESIATLSIEREYWGEPVVFFGKLRTPDRQPLSALMRHLRDWQTQPVEQVRGFRRLIRMAGLPRPVRRAAWGYAYHLSGRRRARVFGTFGVSLTGASGATCRTLLSPLATSLNTGVMDADGRLDVRLHFDHRVLDGMPAARALAELEDVLNGQVRAEVRQMAGVGRIGVRGVDVIVRQ